ncbi:MAG: hypothetical protein LC746_13270, partial [Acidobacteria bacterium]|nr:hypothetical protein [Acidobacteriota bacterium]
FVLLGVSAAIWTCVVAWSERRLEWRPVAYVGVGIIAGLVVNPYFPHDIRLLYEHAVMKIGVSDENRPSVGNEWYPYDSWVFVQNCAVAFLAMLVGYVTTDLQDRRRSARALFFLALSTLLLVANAKWRRYAEFFPPFAVLFAAFSVEALLARRTRVYGELPDEVLEELRPYLDSDPRAEEDDSRERRWRRWEAEAALVALVFGGLIFLFVEFSPRAAAPGDSLLRRLVAQLLVVGRLGDRHKMAVAAAAFLVFAVAYPLTRGLARGALTVLFVLLFVNAAFTVWIEGRTEIRDSAPPEEYRAGIEWIRANVPAGETIFNTDWDDFPKLFFYDPSHAYVSGLDPTYLYDADHDLSKLYENITLGKVKDPGPLIRERFHARYVFTDNDQGHDDFYNNALDSGWFEVAYEDKDGACNCTVLRIRDRKGEPPPDSNKDDDKDDSDEPDDDGNGNNDNSAHVTRARPRWQIARSSSTAGRLEGGKASGE